MLLRLQNIVLDREKRPILKNCSLELDSCQRIGIIGANGSGKTSLLWLMLGLVRPQSGEVEIFGKSRVAEHDFQEIRGDLGLLFQNSEDQLFCSTVREDIAFGPLNRGKSASEALQIVHGILSRLEMTEFEHRITHHLSGGEKRLIALASVLAMEPQILLLDEPDSDLDPQILERVKRILDSLSVAMIIVSHNRPFLESVCHRILLLQDGKLCEPESISGN